MLKRNFRAGKTVPREYFAKLADALRICAGTAPHVEMIAHHHHVAALKRTGCLNVLDFIILKELANGGYDALLFSVAGCCARIGDDGARSRDDRNILDKARIGKPIGALSAAFLARLDQIILATLGIVSPE